jgi:NAD(P)-dependent dehydrogenase (short-subunit alcohol dehydrogenase family)
MLTGRVVVVTGSSRGIGREVAALLVSLGASVVVNGREAAVVAEVAEELGALGLPGDPSVPGVAAAMRDEVLSQHGRVDALITVQGVVEPPGSSILDVTRSDWDALIGSHVTATFEAVRAFAPDLVAARGSIVTTGSHAFLGMYGGTGYPAGKGAVVSLTYALATELADRGVRVNCVCPGARTRMSTGPEYEDAIRALNARGLLDDAMRDASLDPAPPEHCAPLYAYLVSDLAADVTGRVLAASGGYVGELGRPRERLLAYRDAAAGPYSLPEIAALVAGTTQSG